MKPRIGKCCCNHSFRIHEKDGSALRCPSCGKMTAFPGKEMHPEMGEGMAYF